MKTRITKTLLDSWAYTFDCMEGYEDDAMNDFITTLKREPIGETDAIVNGKIFEKLVQDITEGKKPEELTADWAINAANGGAIQYGKYPKWYAGAKKIADIVQGGQWQVHVDTDLHVAGRDLWLHGFCDVVKAGVIYDIKFKNKSFGGLDLYGSYRNHSQHSAYLRCLPEAYEFVYLVSDGDELYTEAYNRLNSRPIEEIIAEFFAWLETKPELLQIYEERWQVE